MDTGPTVMTMRGILAETLAAAGSDIDELITLNPIDPMYRAVFPDGSTISARQGIDAMREEIREKCGAKEAEQFTKFCGWLDRAVRTWKCRTSSTAT